MYFFFTHPLSTYYKEPARIEKLFIFNFEHIREAWISCVLGVKHLLTVGCADPSWHADGYCDDVNNNEACFFDGGDCCGGIIDPNYCTECLCLEEGGGED